ncbi:MAG: hypothetical protein R6V49_04855 [Bacteroidales bacterium]
MKRALNTLVIAIGLSLTLSGQPLPDRDGGTENLIKGYGYGLGGGITHSSYTGDSAGYTGIGMPYAGGFISLALRSKAGLNAAFHYTVKGINRETPYERYRYTYISSELTGYYRFMDFLLLEGGYRYGLEHASRMIILNGANASGVEKRDVPGFGSYGQWVAGASVRVGPATSVVFRYGIPSPSVPMTHFQAGIRFDLSKQFGGSKVLEKQHEQTLARLQAQQLREGVLLVRLKSMRSTILALEEYGRFTEAQEVKASAGKEHQEVINGFKALNFCKVLYFYDYHSNLVRSGELDTILLNDRLEPVSPDSITGKIFVAEFGEYESPEKSYHVRHDYQYLKENNISPDSSAAWITYGHKGLGIGGIVMMDQQFEPLLQPFPVFTPITNKTIFRFDDRYTRAVRKLNDKLFSLLFSE